MWAGGLIAVAIVGPAIWDGFWLALVPAAILLIVAVSDLHAEWRPGDGRIGAVGARLLALAATALVVLSLLDAAIVASRGVEPGWMETADRLAGYAVMAGALLFGIGAIGTGRVPRWAAVAFAMSLPLGIGIDAATEAFPYGELFFFAGYGFYIGLGLFACSLVRLGFAARTASQPPGAILGPAEAGHPDPRPA